MGLIDIHYHETGKSDNILQKLSLIIQKLNQIIMTNEEILAKLEEADEATNEIAADIQSLIDSQGVSEEVAAKLQGHVDKLKTVAATHTP